MKNQIDELVEELGRRRKGHLAEAAKLETAISTIEGLSSRRQLSERPGKMVT